MNEQQQIKKMMKHSWNIQLERGRQRNTRKYKNKMDEMLAPDTGFVVVSGNADNFEVIKQVNDNFVDLFGWERDNVINCSITKIMPPVFCENHKIWFKTYERTGVSNTLCRIVKVYCINNKGHLFEANLLVKPLNSLVFGI